MPSPVHIPAATLTDTQGNVRYFVQWGEGEMRTSLIHTFIPEEEEEEEEVEEEDDDYYDDENFTTGSPEWSTRYRHLRRASELMWVSSMG